MQKWTIEANFIVHCFAKHILDEKELSEQLSELQVSLKYMSLELKLVLGILQYSTFFCFPCRKPGSFFLNKLRWSKPC